MKRTVTLWMTQKYPLEIKIYDDDEWAVAQPLIAVMVASVKAAGGSARLTEQDTRTSEL